MRSTSNVTTVALASELLHRMIPFVDDSDVYYSILPLFDTMLHFLQYWDDSFADSIIDKVIDMCRPFVPGLGEYIVPYNTILFHALSKRKGVLRHPVEKYSEILKTQSGEKDAERLIRCIANAPTNMQYGNIWVDYMVHLVELSQGESLFMFNSIFDVLLSKIDANVQPILKQMQTPPDETEISALSLVYYYARRYSNFKFEPAVADIQALLTAGRPRWDAKSHAFGVLLLMLEYPDLVPNKQQLVADNFSRLGRVTGNPKRQIRQLPAPLFAAFANSVQCHVTHAKLHYATFFKCFLKIPPESYYVGLKTMRLFRDNVTSYEEWEEMVETCCQTDEEEDIVDQYCTPFGMFAKPVRAYADVLFLE